MTYTVFLYLRDYDNRISWVIGQNYVKITGPKKNLKSILKEKQTITKKYLFSKTRGESLKKWARCVKLQFISIVAILNKTVVNSFSLLLKTAIVNKNGPLYVVFPPHQLQYVIWLSKRMIQIMTHIYHFQRQFSQASESWWYKGRTFI